MESNKPPVPQRKQWDKGEWAAKARERDMENAQVAKEREKAMQEGRRYVPREDGPKPTAHAQAHGDLQLDKNLGKTMLVQQTAGDGARGAGFYCELCNRTFKDSLSYLDHLNSRFHLSKLGQSTYVARSTVAQVRERIRQLREQSKSKVDAQNYDFDQRLNEVRGAEKAKRDARRAERRRKRQEEREADELARVGAAKGASRAEVDAAVQAQAGIEATMGFSGFSAKKR